MDASLPLSPRPLTLMIEDEDVANSCDSWSRQSRRKTAIDRTTTPAMKTVETPLREGRQLGLSITYRNGIAQGVRNDGRELRESAELSHR
jgi:hypothetical protein